MPLFPTTARRALLLALGLLSTGAAAQDWQLDRLVPGGPFKGIHGLGFGPDGQIYVGSVMGQSVHRVDPASGATAVLVPPPAGMADDVEFGPDGTLYYTGYMQGTLLAKPRDQGVRVLARGLPGLNSLAVNREGRLFATQVFLGDALWEFDPAGVRPPRKIMEQMGGLNGFDFGPDGRLCGPLWFKRQVVCVDVDSGAMEVVAEDFTVPAAANFDSQGRLHAIDNETGEIFRIDIAAKTRTRIATAPTNLDNLAFDGTDRLFVSNMSDNAIYEVDTASGSLRTVIGSPLSLPGGIALAGGTLYVADTFTLSAVDIATGEVRDISRSLAATGFPTTLAAGATRIATASFESGTVQLWDRDSEKPLARWQGLAAPGALAMLDATRVAVAEIGSGRLVVLDSRRPPSREVLAEGLAQPMGLLYRDGRFLVSEAASGRVIEIAGKGAPRVVVGDLAQPEGIATMPDGRIAVAETGTGRLLLIHPASGLIEVAARGLPLGIPDIPQAPRGIIPTGVAVAEDGTIYVSSDREGSILRLSPPG